jgi:hypothetical protein
MKKVKRSRASHLQKRSESMKRSSTRSWMAGSRRRGGWGRRQAWLLLQVVSAGLATPAGQQGHHQRGMGKGEGRGRWERGRADGREGWGLTSTAGILLWWSMQIKAGGGGQSEMQIEAAGARCRGGWGRRPEQSESERQQRSCEARARSIGLRRRNGEEAEVAGRDIWLSVTYAWRIMCNMRHAYLTLSQIQRGL